MKSRRKTVHFIGLIAVIAGFSLFSVGGESRPSDTINSVVESFEKYHFSPQPIDNALSERIFNLYLKRIDPGKRFLRNSDIEALSKYKHRLDEDIQSGNLAFASAANTILKSRIKESQKIYKEIINKPVSFSGQDVFETDGDRRIYAKSVSEWKADWQNFIKYQILTTYITDAENATSNAAESVLKKIDPKFEIAARNKVKKNMSSYFDRLSKETDSERINAFIDCIANAQDPHTSYLAPQQKDDFDINIKGSLQGIGALLQEEDGVIKVTRLIPGGPAAKQKELKAMDAIIKVSQDSGDPVDIVGMRVQDAVRLIRGPKGTKVTLTIRKPEGKIGLITITRDIVVLEESYSKSAIINTPHQKIGYIILPSFYRDFSDAAAHNASDDVRKELERIKRAGATAVILDLRNNGGGALDDAVKVAGLFIDYGPVVQVRDRKNKGYQYKDQDPSISFKGDLVVLVNSLSASAAEIVSAALQDYNRAIIIGGNHTYGKGTVQTVLDLESILLNKSLNPGTGSIKVTTQKYFRITGGSTQFKGVEPDIIVPEVNDYLEIGEKNLSHPLSWSTTTTARIRKWSANPVLPEQVLERSKHRVKNNPEFMAMTDLIQKLKTRRKTSQYPLNLEKAAAAQKEAKQESAALDALKAKNSELTSLPSDEEALLAMELERKTEYQEWLQQLPKDIYINEACAVLNDLLSQRQNAKN